MTALLFHTRRYNFIWLIMSHLFVVYLDPMVADYEEVDVLS